MSDESRVDAPAFATDMRAEALLLTVVAQTGGDLRAAYAALCIAASVTTLPDEDFEQSVGRAVRALFARPGVLARLRLGSAAPPASA